LTKNTALDYSEGNMVALKAQLDIVDDAKPRGISFNIYALSLIIGGVILLTIGRKINDNKAPE